MPSRVSFGDSELDPASLTLTRAGVPVPLQPQPARVLAILVGRAGEVATRAELRQQIWYDGAAVDFERGLNFCIAQVRSALGDDAESPRFVETLPRRGYRFIGRVQHGSERAARPVARRGRLAVLAAIAIGAALTGASAWWLGGGGRVRLAVVPFNNESGLDDLEAVARGISDATVARLATPDRVSRLDVIGNAAVLSRPRTFRDLKRIGAHLDVDYILLAQMKRDDSGLRLIAHLIRTSDEAHVWARSYDRPAFTLDAQAEIAESIASEAVHCLTEGCREAADTTP
jgi:DNA-binding winged helix-turn-helix (wHTH) protein/TolB-like protein